MILATVNHDHNHVTVIFYPFSDDWELLTMMMSTVNHDHNHMTFSPSFSDDQELLTMIMSGVTHDHNHVTVSVDPCESAPCLNGGQCVRVDGANFTCKCPPDYTGHRCEMFGRFLCPSVCACMRVSICEYVCLCNMCVCLFVSVCLSVCLSLSLSKSMCGVCICVRVCI